MKVAIIGSRGLVIDNLEDYVDGAADEIVSGGARGIDECAARFALEKGLKLTVFLPEYKRYGRRAPLVRNIKIVEYADLVIAFWDGTSRGTMHVIEKCREAGREHRIILMRKE